MNSKRLLAIASIAAMLLSGCTKKDPYAGTTQINVWNYVGTMDNIEGQNWITKAAQRFEALHENDSYGEGKTGVHINFDGSRTLNYDHNTFKYGADIYIDEYRAKINELAGNDLLLDISDVVNEINTAHPIDPAVINRLKGGDGKYYALPQYEWFSGVSFDRDAFNSENYYFADPEEDEVEPYSCSFGSVNFVASSMAKKSVGPDGVANTVDDGLPSTLQELCVLFNKVKEDNYNPIIIGGSKYEFYLVMGLWSALAGKNVMDNSYCNFGEPVRVVKYDGSGKMLFTDKDIFGNAYVGGNQIREPQTEVVTLNDTNGYLLHQTVERYYALSFLELCKKMNWFNEAYTSGDPSTGEIQDAFINGGRNGKNLILLDSSYWYHEAESKHIFEDYARSHPESPEKHVEYMPLPTGVAGQVAEGAGKKQALLDLGSSMLFVTKRAADEEDKLAVVKDFIKFLYSDSELATFTETTGMTVPMQYSFDNSKIDYFNTKLIELKNQSEVVRYSSDHVAFRKYQDKFSLTWGSPLIGITIGGVDYLQSGYYKMLADKHSAETIFSTGRMQKSSWDSLLK